MTKSPSPSVDEVAFEAARSAYEAPENWSRAPSDCLHAAIAAYLASLVPPPKAEVREPVAWLCYGGADGKSGKQFVTRGIIDGHVIRPSIDIPLYANHEARGDGVRVTDESLPDIRRGLTPEFIEDRYGPAAVAALPVGYGHPTRPPLGDGRAEIDGNDLWEMLFAITKDCVPEGLTDEVLNELAKAINIATGAAS